MSESRKKPGVAFWATVAAMLVVLVGYPLSTGPVVWLHDHGFLPDWAEPVIEAFYWPLSLLPRDIVQAIDQYAGLWQ